MSRNIFKKLVVPASVALLAIMATGCGDNRTAQSGGVTAVSGKAAIGGAFSLTDHTGRAATHEDFFGKPQLVYFGFAFCPDVCPTALQQMGAALELSGRAAQHYQPLFITVDAERDTPEKLALYVTASGFPKNLIGLTGTAEQIEDVKKVFSVYGKKVEDPASAAGFTFDHTSIIYLMDAKGEFVDAFSSTDTPDKIAARLISYKKTGR